MSVDLSPNCIKEYASGSTDFSSVVQIIKMKKVGKGKAKKKKRIRVWISDGTHYVAAIMGKSKEEIEKMKLKKFSIIKVNDIVLHVLGDRKILVILSFDAVNVECSEKIGNPTSIQLDVSEKVQPITPQKPQLNQVQNPVQQTFPGNGQEDTARNQNFVAPQRPPMQQQHQQQFQQPQQGYQQQQQQFQQPQRGPVGQKFSPSPLKKGRAKKSGFGNPRFGRNKPIANLAATKRMPLREADVRPINHLNPYDEWVIKVRVTQVGQIREWHKAERSGKLQSVTVVDGEKSEIEMIMFNEVVDKFSPVLEVGGLYLIGFGKVKHSNRNYSKHAYQIVLQGSSQVERINEDNSVPVNSFNFIDLAFLDQQHDQTLHDVFGLVQRMGEKVDINTKRGNVVAKREFELMNKSPCDGNFRSVNVTLWGRNAENPPFRNGDIVCMAKIRKGSYGGVSLSTVSTTKIDVNPNIPEVGQLRQILANSGPHVMSAQNITQPQRRQHMDSRKGRDLNREAFDTLSDIKLRRLGTNRPDYITVQGYITHIDKGKKLWYHGCPKETSPGKHCRKKLEELDSQGKLFKCKRCNAEFSQSDPRYIFSAQLQDSSGMAFATVFHETAIKLFGMEPMELQKVYDADDQHKAYERVLRRARKKFRVFKLKIHTNTYMGNQEVKTVVQSMYPVNFGEMNRKLINLIHKYDQLEMMDMTE